jgi:hypothetical protein
LKTKNDGNGLNLFNISSDVYKLYEQTLFLFFLFDKKHTKTSKSINKLILSQNAYTQILLNTLFSFVLKDTKNTASFSAELIKILNIVEFIVNEQTINAVNIHKMENINAHFEYVNQKSARLIPTMIYEGFIAYLPSLYMKKNVYNILASLETSFFESFSAFFETAFLIEKNENFDFSKYFLFEEYFKNYETCSEEVTLDAEDPHLEIYSNYLKIKNLTSIENLKLFDYLGSLLFKVIQQDTITVDISCNSEKLFYNVFKDVHNLYRVGFAFSNPSFYGRDDLFFHVSQTIVGVIFYEAKECLNVSLQLNKFSSTNIFKNELFDKYLFISFVYTNISNNFIDKNNFLNSLEKIKTLYALNSNFNVITFQHPSLRNYSFNQMKSIPFATQNRFLLSSQFDNFYLADDFSKLSILMKRCSDTILERSIFKKF